jgi:hypothetical protein
MRLSYNSCTFLQKYKVKCIITQRSSWYPSSKHNHHLPLNVIVSCQEYAQLQNIWSVWHSLKDWIYRHYLN